MTSTVPSKKYSKKSLQKSSSYFDAKSYSNSSENLVLIDERQELENFGFDVDYGEFNHTDLYIDEDTGYIYFASVDAPNNKQELYYTDYDNFGSILQGSSIEILAIEVFNDKNPFDAEINDYIVFGYIEDTYDTLVSYVFDQNGVLSNTYLLTNEENNLTDYLEDLFGFDFSSVFDEDDEDDEDDGYLPEDENLVLINETQELEDFGFDTFDVSNNTDLYIDEDTGDLYFASVDDPNNKQEIYDANYENFGINLDYGITPVSYTHLTLPTS